MNAIAPFSATAPRAEVRMNALVPTTITEAVTLAEVMSKASLVPDHLRNKPGDCLLVVMQAQRWGMDPVSVAQCTSVVRGKLCYEGNLAAARIAEHQRREQERLDAERERIRAEEEAKARQAAEASLRASAVQAVTGATDKTVSTPQPQSPNAPVAPATATMNLSTLNMRVAPLAVTAEGLASLGFHPVGTDRAAKLYAAEAFPAICTELIRVLRDAMQRADNERRAA